MHTYMFEIKNKLLFFEIYLFDTFPNVMQESVVRYTNDSNFISTLMNVETVLLL